MRYSDDIPKSGEYLRQALALMAKQDAALHPVSYAVWYEFVSGINPGLMAELSEIIARGEVLTEASTEALFRKHIAEIDEETAQRISIRFQRALADMSQSTTQVENQASQFGNSLEQWSEDLSKSSTGTELETAEISRMLQGARNMQDAVSSLKERLEISQRQTDALKQEVNRARADAMTDGLTELSNRKAFDIALAECLDSLEPTETGPSLLMADIDHFKNVNDTYGHLLGDKVIRSIAQIIKQNVKGKDTAARYGGEEFIILLPNTPLKGAQVLAETIRAAVERSRIKRTDSNETIAKITISIGVASYIQGESESDFIGRADKALYKSKNLGRNRVTPASAESQ